MDDGDRTSIATFYAPFELPASGEVVLGEREAHHARVRRIGRGDPVRLTNGRGTIARGTVHQIRKGDIVVDVDTVRRVPEPSSIELFVPVADRDRMLLAAEKCTELGVRVWQPVIFERSRSVSPRGEGKAFADKVRSRMISAVEQSGGAWLPELRPERGAAEVADAEPTLDRFVLDANAPPLLRHEPRQDAAILVGPEGGLTPAELSDYIEHGWRAASVASATLRFETAAIAALAVLRAHTALLQEVRHG